MRRANFKGSNLEGGRLQSVDCREAVFENVKLEQAVLREVNAAADVQHPPANQFQNAKFHGAHIVDSDFSGCVFRRANFDRSRLSRVDLSGCDLTNSSLEASELVSVNFSRSHLNAASFHRAKLVDCDLREVTVDQSTRLAEVISIQGCKIDRFTLEMLIGQGVLTAGQRMVMNIEDDVAKLRLSFGGFYRWLHAIAIITFVFPYVWFVILHHVLAQFGSEARPSIPLVEALARYIVSGGRTWSNGWQPDIGAISLFVLALVLNAVRFAMLWKTSVLEHQEQITTLPARWTLRSHKWWNRCYQASRWAIWAFAILAVLHSLVFLWNPIPLPKGVTP